MNESDPNPKQSAGQMWFELACITPFLLLLAWGLAVTWAANPDALDHLPIR